MAKDVVLQLIVFHTWSDIHIGSPQSFISTDDKDYQKYDKIKHTFLNSAI